MPYYEIIYETGEHSIACYEDDDEALSATGEQNRRATAGEKASSTRTDGPPATRIVRVLKYDNHPADYNTMQVLNAKQVDSTVHSVADNTGIINVPELVSRLRDKVSPLQESDPHESNYKMEESTELDLPWIEKAA